MQDSKDQRGGELHSTTDDLLKHLAEKIEATKAAARRAMEDPDVLDAPPDADADDKDNDAPNGKEKYSAIRQFTKLAHSADVEEMVQPSILVVPAVGACGRTSSGLQDGFAVQQPAQQDSRRQMGLGKTIQCLLLAYLAENKGVKDASHLSGPGAGKLGSESSRSVPTATW